MKQLLTICGFSLVLALSALGQDTTPSPSVEASPAVAASPVATASIVPGASAAASITPAAAPRSSSESDLERSIEEKVRKHFRVSVDHGKHEIGHDFDAGEMMAIPIVGIIFTTLFGAPVMVVGIIMLMSYLKARSLHRTVRTMVEKGQEVPAALFTAPAAQRVRSDMRRGIVLSMIGIGLIIFLGTINGWSEGEWSFGMIPLLIGAGYLLVWKLEGRRDNGRPVS
jgi:hypothetical protein